MITYPPLKTETGIKSPLWATVESDSTGYSPQSIGFPQFLVSIQLHELLECS